MKVSRYNTGPHDSETCQWCGAEIHNVTLIIDDQGSEYILGPECGEKAVKAVYAAEQQRLTAARYQAEQQRMASARREYVRRFGNR